VAVVVPFAPSLIAGVLYGATTSLIDTFIIVAQIPVACVGGISRRDNHRHAIQFLGGSRIHFDLLHRPVMDGVLLSFYIRQLWDEGHQFVESIVLGSTVGFRARR
jgi:Cu/Ag efflux pump CusA